VFRRPRLTVALVAAVTLAAARPLAAQAAVRVSLAPDSTAAGVRVPLVRADSVLADERWLSALRSGLPVRLHYRVESWRMRDGWFDALVRHTEWDVVVRHEPLLDQYSLLTLVGRRRQERRYATLDALGAALGFTSRVNIPPAAPDRYYYTAQLTITTLSDSDLDELKRFLEGDLGDVAGGRESFGDALGRGATRFLLRLAGLPTVRVEARSPAFTVRPEPPAAP
jgi:hypothetical protein